MSNNARTGIGPQEPQIDDTLYTYDQSGPNADQVYEITDPLVIAQDAPALAPVGAPVIVPDIDPDAPAIDTPAPDEPALDLGF